MTLLERVGQENDPNYLFQGIEKKSAKLQGSEKAVVARHEAGHAVVGTAVANLLPGQPRVEVNHEDARFLTTQMCHHIYSCCACIL